MIEGHCDRSRERAHSVETWGAFEVHIHRFAAHTEEGSTVISIDPWRTKPFRRRVGVTWKAEAFRDGQSAYSGDLALSKADALASVRKRMRKNFDAIPDRIESLEAEYARLTDVLRGGQ